MKFEEVAENLQMEFVDFQRSSDFEEKLGNVSLLEKCVSKEK